MKEVKYYECEKCLGKYESKLKAQECECSHIEVESIESWKFKNHAGCDNPPSEIIVKLKDGRLVRYNFYETIISLKN